MIPDAFLRDFFKQNKEALLRHRKAGSPQRVEKHAKDIEERSEQQGRTEDDHLGRSAKESGALTRSHCVALAHGLDFCRGCSSNS